MDKKAAETGKIFIENLHTCNFRACDILCTDNGKEEVRWFASNLTAEDLALISKDVEVEIEEYESSDSVFSVVYTAKNIIVCDSLETKGHIGERALKVVLRNINGNWKVDKLEWQSHSKVE